MICVTRSGTAYPAGGQAPGLPRAAGAGARRCLGDNRVKMPGSQLHNRVHLWIGGNMAPMTSPNDPVFFLHHCFIDKVWADWQAVQAKRNPDAAPHYAPERYGPPGHNLDDRLNPWTRTPREVLDITALGYQYAEPSGPRLLATAVTPHAHGTRSPFWAD